MLMLTATTLTSGSPAALAGEPDVPPEIDVTITPSRIEVETIPGVPLETSVRVYNDGVTPLVFRTSFQDIEYAPGELIGPDELAFTATRWAVVDREQFLVEPGQFEDVTLTIHTPLATPSGGYHALFFVETVVDEGAADIRPSARIGSTLLVVVSPEGEMVDRSARLTLMDLEVHWDGWFSPRVDTVTRIENTGNAHVLVGGVHSYRGWPGGGRVDQELGPITLLRGTRSVVQSSWSGVPLFGKVTVTSELVYQVGPDELPVILTQETIWIIPVHLILVLLALLAVAAFFLIRRRRSGRPIWAVTRAATRDARDPGERPDTGTEVGSPTPKPDPSFDETAPVEVAEVAIESEAGDHGPRSE